jgi:hypothetical protein
MLATQQEAKASIHHRFVSDISSERNSKGLPRLFCRCWTTAALDAGAAWLPGVGE